MLQSSNQLKDYWNKYSDVYGLELEPVYLQSALALTRMLKLEEKKNILEVGCGTGELTLYWLKHLPDGCKYTSIDLSDDMLKIAAKKKDAVKEKLNKIDHVFANIDAVDLKMIENETIDAYVASLVLHLAPHPENMLQEAHRVLKKGGEIGLTVLGKPEDCSFFRITHDTLKNNGIDLPAKSSGGLPPVSRETLIKIVQDNGFQVEFCWKEALTFDVLDDRGLIKMLGQPRISKILGEVGEEKRRKIEEDIKAALAQLKTDFMPPQAEMFYLTARKPL